MIIKFNDESSVMLYGMYRNAFRKGIFQRPLGKIERINAIQDQFLKF